MGLPESVSTETNVVHLRIAVTKNGFKMDGIVGRKNFREIIFYAFDGLWIDVTANDSVVSVFALRL